jgi:RNA polymerase sigma-70 factor (ECF subfamily)
MDFERLANRHKDVVYRQLVRVCRSREDAEDALAEALLAAYRSAGSLRSEEAFRSWLTMIGRRACIKSNTRARLGAVLGLDDLELPAEDSPERDLEFKQLKGCVNDAVLALPPTDRETYVLREIEGRSAGEVSKKLGLTVPAVKSRLYRARRFVREYLDCSVCTD